MARVKISPADTWFSKCVRERTGWVCEVCGGEYEEGAQGLHCSHYFGRRAYGVRFDPNNAFSHCFGCHQRLGSNPDDFSVWVEKAIGEGMIQILRERREDVGLAKLHKKNLKDVAAHYKAEHARMKQERADGATGRIEFVGFA